MWPGIRAGDPPAHPIRTGDILTRETENIQQMKKIVDKGAGGWYTNRAKQRGRSIRLTSSRMGEEVNNVVTRLPKGGLLLRGCRIGIRVL